MLIHLPILRPLLSPVSSVFFICPLLLYYSFVLFIYLFFVDVNFILSGLAFVFPNLPNSVPFWKNVNRITVGAPTSRLLTSEFIDPWVVAGEGPNPASYFMHKW